jgi:hypothetical protein
VLPQATRVALQAQLRWRADAHQRDLDHWLDSAFTTDWNRTRSARWRTMTTRVGSAEVGNLARLCAAQVLMGHAVAQPQCSVPCERSWQSRRAPSAVAPKEERGR